MTTGRINQGAVIIVKRELSSSTSSLGCRRGHRGDDNDDDVS